MDEARWIALYRAKILQLAARQGADPGELEDICQDAWLVWEARAPQWASEAEATAWLSQVVRRLLSNARRHSSRQREVPEEDVGERVSWQELATPHPEAQLSDLQEAALARAALADLPPHQADVVALYASGTASMKEVAEFLGIPEPTAYARYRAGVRRATARAREVLPAPPHPAPPHPHGHAPCESGHPSEGVAGATIASLGRVVFIHWTGRMGDGLVSLEAALWSRHLESGEPVVIVSSYGPDFSFGNALDREMLRNSIRRTSPYVESVVMLVSGLGKLGRLAAMLCVGGVTLALGDTRFVLPAEFDSAEVRRTLTGTDKPSELWRALLDTAHSVFPTARLSLTTGDRADGLL